MQLKKIYEDKNLLVISKPAGMTMVNLKKHLPESNLSRKGLVHRLDKETSGVLLVAKNNRSLQFFQNQFKKRRVEKTYLALVWGKIKQESGTIKTLIGRDKKGIKQKAYLLEGPKAKRKGPRIAETDWKIIKRYQDYTLIKVEPKTGRKHQIRAQLAWLGHPLAGDKLYAFKNQKTPKGLTRQFLHANSLKIKMLDNGYKKFTSPLPQELKNVLTNL